jgi:hypothetical protein
MSRKKRLFNRILLKKLLQLQDSVVTLSYRLWNILADAVVWSTAGIKELIKFFRLR